MISLPFLEDTYFVELKTGALKWSPDLTNEYHNTFINSANGIVKTVSKSLTDQ